MVHKVDEHKDLDLVSAFFTDRGLSVERFGLSDTQTGKTPDLKVIQSGELVAFCEVKSPNDPWLDTLLDNAPPLTIVGGARNDPIFNRIARHINKATNQFCAVNPSKDKFNILAFVNHDNGSTYNDLIEITTGFFHDSQGNKHATVQHIANGIIGQCKMIIDLYIWFERRRDRSECVLFNLSDPERLRRLCEILSMNPAKIDRR
jgi:hypothetical protein